VTHNYAIFQTNEISYLTSCIKTATYGVSPLTIKAPKWDKLGELRNLGVGDRIFIQMKGLIYSGPFFVTKPHPQFEIKQSLGSWHEVDVERTPPDVRPIWIFDKPWCLFFDPELSMQVNYCSSGIIHRVGLKLPPMGMLSSEEGERLWENIDDFGSPFSDFIQRQGGFAYHGFYKTPTQSFHTTLSTKHLIGNSKSPIRYRSKNGVLVRSKSEVLIANFLHDRGIRFEYERPIVLGKSILRPDFYLPDCQVYIEHLGLYDSNPDYRRDWEWRKSLFESNRVKVVTMMESDITDLDAILLKKLAGVGCV
jgi:hypothetical protein